MSTASGQVMPDRPAGASPPAIIVDGLVKRYAGRAVVAGLSFEVRRGEILALLGPNGAGKTTTIETIEGYRRPDDGRVRVFGLDPIASGDTVRARLGLMLQGGGGVYPQARPRELLHLFARFYRRPEDPDALLERVGLGHVADRRFGTLSGGEKQRLSLALALVGRPELVVLDEPTAGLDPAAKAETRELVAGLRSDGVTVLLATHELADVERLADRIVLVDRGRLVSLGTPAELMGDARRMQLRLTPPAAPTRLAELQTIVSMVQAGARLLDAGDGFVRLENVVPSPALVAAIAGWCRDADVLLTELQVGAGSLEERYLELLSQEPAS